MTNNNIYVPPEIVDTREEETSLLDDMNAYFDRAGQEQDELAGREVIRPSSSQQSQTDLINVFYQRLADMGMNLDELKPILECDDNLLVLSGAGAGKTTALILKIIRGLIGGNMMRVVTTNSVYGQTHVQVPAKILISTFLKTGAQELQHSFREWCQKLGLVGIDYTNIKFSTIHAEVLDALKSMGVQVKIIEDTNSLLRSVVNKYGIRNVTATSRSLTVDELSDLSLIVSYARNRLDDKRYEHPIMGDYRMDTILLDAVLNDFKIMRSATGGMDFEDMQEMLLEALRMNENVRNFIANRYDFVFVDEFQDTSQLQYELLKYYFAGAKRVMAIGDDDQSIYSWRGGDIDIIGTKFEQDIKPTVLNLSTNYRCKANILNPVIPSIETNSNRHQKQLKSHAEGGEVNIVYNGDVNHMVQSMKVDLVKQMSVGILARTNADLLIPAMILELDGNIHFSISKAVNLNGRMARQVFGALDLVTKRMNKDFEGYLRMFLPRHAWFEAEKLCNVLVTNKSFNIYNIPMEDLKYSVPTLAPFLEGLRKAKDIGGVEAYLYILGVMENQVFTGKSLYAEKARNLVQFTKKIILEHDAVKDLDINQIDNLFNSVLPEKLANRVKYTKSTLVKLTTVHEAKGKEWDSVYIWNNIDGTFPNKVGNREITQEELEEERRVHYIAWTRARTKLTVYTQSGKEGEFLRECDISQAQSVAKEETTEAQKVFKRDTYKVDEPVQTDTLLRNYISKILNQGGLKDERTANLDIVLANYNVEDLTARVDSKYGVHLTKEDEEVTEELFDLFFRELADDIFNRGGFNA